MDRKKTVLSPLLVWVLFLVGLNLPELVSGTGTFHYIYLDQISVRDGLTHNRITDLHQDRFGYVWVATAHGLNQLDGTRIRTFRMRPDDPTSLPANFINRLYESPDGELWLTFGVGGVCRYDRNQGTFHTYTMRRDTTLEQSALVHDITWGDDGVPWLATSAGLFRYEAKPDAFHPIPSFNDPLLPKTQGAVRLVFVDSLLLIAGERGIYTYSPVSGKVEQAKIRRAGKEGGSNEQLAGGWLTAFNPEHASGPWFSLVGHGPLQWKDGALEAPRAQEGTIEARDIVKGPDSLVYLATCENKLYRIEEDEIREVKIPDLPRLCGLATGGRGDLFGLTADNRVFVIDVEEMTWHPLRNQNAKAEHSSTNSMVTGMIDREGNLWMGSFERGVYHEHPDRLGFRLHQGLGEIVGTNYVVSIAETPDGTVWLDTRGGIVKWDRKTEEFKAVEGPPFAQLLTVDRKGRLWAATGKGIVMLGENGEVLRSYLVAEDVPFLNNNTISEDRDGNIWLLNQLGLLKIDPVTGDQTAYRMDDERIQNHHLIHSSYSFYQDKAGNIWVGSVRYGLLKLDPFGPLEETASLTSYLYPDKKNDALRSQTVNYITEGEDGKLWLGCYSTGLLSFDPATHDFTTYPLPDGNVIPNIQGIQIDDGGALWISSSDGLYRFDPHQNIWNRYAEEDGLQSNMFNRAACWKGANGELFFGGMDGVSVFEPKEISSPYQPGKVLIQDIRVKGERFKSENPFEMVEAIELAHHENNLEIDFASVDFLQGGRLRYAYRLVGLNEGWNYTDRPRISYANLTPGTYDLRIKLAVTGMEENAPETALLITITPPFWKTPAFFAILVLMVTGMGFQAHLFRLRAKERKFREIEQVRKKAAADFHDELGHRLTRISLFAEVLQQRARKDEEEIQVYLEKIKTNSQELYQSMRNFLWALDPEKDAVMELAIVLKDFGDEMFDKTGITFNCDELAPALNEVSLNMDWKRNLLLIFKEAMHNALKHSRGQQVDLAVRLEDRWLEIELKDDGKVSEVRSNGKGTGIRNMVDRAGRIGGELRLTSEIAVGTNVLFRGQVPMN